MKQVEKLKQFLELYSPRYGNLARSLSYLLVVVIVVKILGNSNTFIAFYQSSFYPKIATALRTFTGYFSFSIGDIAYTLLGLYLLISTIRNRKKFIQIVFPLLLRTCATLYLLFHVLWAFNYYGPSLAEKQNWNLEYSDTELHALTRKLIRESNRLQFEITKNKSTAVRQTVSDAAVENTVLKYWYLPDYALNYETPSVKKSSYSLVLSYMGFTGYLNPFSGEAQYNYESPNFNRSFTIAHEMAHQLGVGSESECNFYAFQVTAAATDLHLQYAAHATALRYCLNMWKFKNPVVLNFYQKSINPGVLRNFEEADAFWKGKSTFVEKIFETFYDNFLKFNSQKDGISSYGKFINLLIASNRNDKI